MEILIAILIVVALVVAATAAFVAINRQRRGVVLEPPPTTRRGGTAVAEPDTIEAEPDLAGGTVVEETIFEEVVIEDGVVVEDIFVDEIIVEEPVKVSFRDRLGKARGLLAGYFGSVRARSGIDDETWDDLEEALIRADVGVSTTGALLDRLRSQVKAEGIKDPEVLLDTLKADLKDTLAGHDRTLKYAETPPTVWLFVGVNGVGKTTTIGKLAKREIAAGHRLVLAAGDTFRAAAAEQLETWAERSGADLVRGNEGGDPAAVVYDATERATARDLDLVLADTAGRLHTKTNLMEELRKVRRVAEKGSGTVTEVLLVLDATTGQNGLVQAREFTDAVDLTGVVLTKLDGSAKGGIVLAIQQDLGIPVKLVGLGEAIDDLVEFDPDEFVEALFEG
jgi:fused signal recognition particle receptor